MKCRDHLIFYVKVYDTIFKGDRFWEELDISESTTFSWDETSTYIRNPPYFEKFSLALTKSTNLERARALLVLGDSVTTDHISPAEHVSRQLQDFVYRPIFNVHFSALRYSKTR